MSPLVVFSLCPQGGVIIDWNMEAILLTHRMTQQLTGGLMCKGLVRCQAPLEEGV